LQGQANQSGQLSAKHSGFGLTSEVTFVMPQLIDPKHNQTRETLRIVGPAILVVGLIFLVIGVGSFFSSFGSFEPPRLFWCAFVGLPLIGIGLVICKFAFLGAVSRYMANEVAPVGKDVVNYMAEGTKGAVHDIAAAVAGGLRDGTAGSEVRIIRCQKCNTDNEARANFCKGCGTPLAKTKPCPSCGGLNDPDARFCTHCGKPTETGKGEPEAIRTEPPPLPTEVNKNEGTGTS
jgi:hypothetical protein